MFSFGDGFDCYTAYTDASQGYWEPGTGIFNLVAGRFAGSRALELSSATQTYLIKNSGQNDTVHHICCAIRHSAAFSGTNTTLGLGLYDGATAQCTVCIRADGSIVLTSGGIAGTILATYTGASVVFSTWYHFEFEVVVHNSTGSFKVRKNGNTVDDFSATGLDTAGGTANNYANRLQVGANFITSIPHMDDLFWRSDASTVDWMGDIRCITRMPVTDASVQFGVVGTRSYAAGSSSGFGLSVNRAWYHPITPTVYGTVSLVTIPGMAYSGGMKCALFNDNAGAPGTVLAAATSPISGVGTGTGSFTFSPPVPVSSGVRVWIGTCIDTASGSLVGSPATTGYSGTATTYASFPVSNPPSLSGGAAGMGTLVVNPVNAGLVNEAQQDGTATYVYDNIAGHADFYTIAPITSVAANTVAVTTRGYIQKSDAGNRTAAVQIKSGSTTVASPTLALTTSSFQWLWRTDSTDPNTGAAWTAAAVNAAQIGPTIVS